MYAIGLFGYFYYFFLEMDGRVVLFPTDRLVLLGVGSLCVYAGSVFLGRSVQPEAARQVMRLTFRTFFVLYLLLLLTFTLFDDVFGRNLRPVFVWNSGKSWEELRLGLNWVPFRTISLYVWNIRHGVISHRDFLINIFGNLFAFMPLAFFLPHLFPKMRSAWRFARTVTGMILAIELAQFLFQRGSADVDDLILNLSGAMLLFAVLKAPPVRRLIDRLTLR